MVATIAASVVARMYDVGISHGVPTATLQIIIGRDRSELVGDARVAITATFECFAACLRHTNDPSFPLRVAQSVTVEDYAVLGFALITSANAAEAFDRLVRFGHLISDSGSWQANQRSSGVELAWIRAGRRHLGHRAANECAVAELLGGLRRGYGKSLRPLLVSFRHGAPDNTQAHQRYFGAPIKWNASKDAMLFNKQLLKMPALTKNPAMNHFFDNLLKQHVMSQQSCSGRVKQVLTGGLSSGRPSSHDVATKLGMSERSLRRALADEETNFQEVLDDVRRTIALEMLQANQSVTEIAFLLGFSETSALSRAFRRWHGKSIRSQRIGAR
jgi:AraC-like DNA-binding protein